MDSALKDTECWRLGEDPGRPGEGKKRRKQTAAGGSPVGIVEVAADTKMAAEILLAFGQSRCDRRERHAGRQPARAGA